MDKTLENNLHPAPPVFFVIGRPRSGTTLLRFLFDAHPNVVTPPESPFVIGLYKKYRKVTRWDEARIREFADDLYKQRYFDKWLIEKDALVEKLMAARGENTFQGMYREVCLAYKSVFDKKDILMIGDKNPAYSLFSHRIHSLFPDSKIIHITRDYRDNYLSLTKVNFEVPVVPLVVYRWKFSVRQMWRLKRRNPGLVYEIRYEDLVSDPEKTFRDICNFLDLPYDPEVMSFYRKKEEVENAYAGAEELKIVHQSLFNPISTSRVDLWKTGMTARQVRIADLVAGKTAEKAGYRREYTKFNLGLYLWVMPVLIYGAIMYRLILLGDHLPYRLRNLLGRALGIFLKVYWTINRRKVKPL